MADTPPPRERSSFSAEPSLATVGWLGLLALAWLLYELTNLAGAGDGGAVPEVWLGGFPVRLVAVPGRPAAQAQALLLWLYAAWGLLRVRGWPCSWRWASPFSSPPRRAGGPVGMPQTFAALAGTFPLTALVGLTLAVLGTTVAALLAWYTGTQLWLGSAVHAARHCNDWPPSPWCEGRTNQLSRLLHTAMLTDFLLLLLVAALVWQSAQSPLALGLAAVLAVSGVVLIVVSVRHAPRVGLDSLQLSGRSALVKGKAVEPHPRRRTPPPTP